MLCATVKRGRRKDLENAGVFLEEGKKWPVVVGVFDGERASRDVVSRRYPDPSQKPAPLLSTISHILTAFVGCCFRQFHSCATFEFNILVLAALPLNEISGHFGRLLTPKSS